MVTKNCNVTENGNHTRPENSITVREAHRRYGIALSTLHGWIEKGAIEILRIDANSKYLYEPDVYRIAKAHKEKPGRGRASVLRQFTTKNAA